MHAIAVIGRRSPSIYVACMRSVFFVVGVMLGAGCTGAILEPADDRTETPRDPHLAPAGPVELGLRRLTRDELASTLRYALELDAPADVSPLPVDPLSPFDNDYTEQQPSTALVVGIDQLARDLTPVALPDAARLQQLGDCAALDTTCVDLFAARIGRRLLRRPLRDPEASALGTLARSEESPLEGARLVLRTLLQDVELHYRVEAAGGDAGEVLPLDDYALATRLALLVWGSGPDDALLDEAAAGALRTAAGRRAAALRMFEDPRAHAQVQRFHAFWIGYRDIDASSSVADMFRAETEALVERVVFEEHAPWLDLLVYPETHLTPELAAHYGIDGVESAGFYPAPEGRAGILGHGSFLANGGVRGDSSPTRRGLFVRSRWLCHDIELPDEDLEVDVDEPPSSNGCKPERYSVHAHGACAGCHALMDPIGFGLEAFDLAGRHRTMEAPGTDGEGVPYPECEIEAQGEVAPLGAFSGPEELGVLLHASPEVQLCAATQLFRFATGRRERAGDGGDLAAMRDAIVDGGSYLDVLLAYVTSERFTTRKVE